MDTDDETAGPGPEIFKEFYCSCGADRRARNDAMLQQVADDICEGERDRVVTAVVYALQNYSAQIVGIPSDMWSAVVAETEDRTFRTWIECDLIEHGFAGTYLAFKERFPEGHYLPAHDEDEGDDD